MESPKTPENLEAQDPGYKTLEDSMPEISVEQNGKGFDVNDTCVGVDNVEMVKRVVEVEERNDGTKGENVVMDLEATHDDKESCMSCVGTEKGCLGDVGLDRGNEVQKGSADSNPAEVSVGNERKAVGVEKTVQQEGMKDNGGSGLDGADSSKKIEVSRNVASLFVDICGPPCGLTQDNPNEERCCGLMASKKSKKDENVEEDKAADNPGYSFSVGDVVWVKTKSQTWWPGQIHDPVDLPEHAAKNEQGICLFIGYFGSSHVAWCSVSQLRPLHGNFEHMLGQSKSRSFIGAVEKAVREFGRRIKLEMTCSCASKQLPPAAGEVKSKEGVTGPDLKSGKFGEYSITQFEPAKFLLQLKDLALAVSVPGMIESAVAQNRLSAFYSYIGHCQLPMHQLRDTSDIENIDDDKLVVKGKFDFQNEDQIMKTDEGNIQCSLFTDLQKETEVLGNKDLLQKKTEAVAGGLDGIVVAVLEDCKGNAAGKGTNSYQKTLRSIKRKKENNSEVINGSESRERKKSRYLSFPYINWGNKGVPAETDDQGVPKVPEGVDMNANPVQPSGSPAIAKCNNKRFWRKWYNKFISGSNTNGNPELINASSAELLSKLHFAAVHCLYPSEDENFDSIALFFSRFRISVYHDESFYEAHWWDMAAQNETVAAESSLLVDKEIKNSSPAAKTSSKKRKKKAILQHAGAEVTAGVPNVVGSDVSGSQHVSRNPDTYTGKDLKINQPSTNGKPKGKVEKKKGKRNSGQLKTKSLSGLSDVNINIATSGSSFTDYMEMEHLNSSGKPKKTKSKKGVASPMCLQMQPATQIPDLNGNCAIPLSSVEDQHVADHVTSAGKPEPKKRKRKGAASGCPEIQITSGVQHLNRNITEAGSLVIDLGVMTPHTLDGITQKKDRLNSKLAGGLQSSTGNDLSLVLRDPLDITPLAVEGKPRKRVRKRKVEAKSEKKLTVGIPDLNGTSADYSPLGKEFQEINGFSSQVTSERKKRRRKGEATSKHPRVQLTVGRPDININHDGAEINGEVSEIALLLTFAPGAMPPREDLLATFSRFGPLKESGTQLLKDSGGAQLVFMRSADAGEALLGLEKNNPFGAALVNYRLRHLSTVTGVTTSGVPPSELIPTPGAVPAIDFIQQNLQMMTSVLEKSGDNLSPETRAKLDGEIKGLMKKVTTIAGSSVS